MVGGGAVCVAEGARFIEQLELRERVGRSSAGAEVLGRDIGEESAVERAPMVSSIAARSASVRGM